MKKLVFLITVGLGILATATNATGQNCSSLKAKESTEDCIATISNVKNVTVVVNGLETGLMSANRTKDCDPNDCPPICKLICKYICNQEGMHSSTEKVQILGRETDIELVLLDKELFKEVIINGNR